MTMTQTVEVPASHRLTIDVPRDVPTGKVILAFIPAPQNAGDDGLYPDGECPICAAAFPRSAALLQHLKASA